MFRRMAVVVFVLMTAVSGLFAAVPPSAPLATQSSATQSSAAQPAGTTTAPPPSVLMQDEAHRFDVHVTPEMIRHSHITHTLYFADVVYSVILLLFVLASGLSARMRDLARRIVAQPFLSTMVYFLLFSIVTTILELPLSYYSDFVVPHQFDLTDQTLAAWLTDLGKGFLVNVIIGSVVTALALLGMRKVRRWWLAVWLGSIPLLVLGIVVAPVFIDPIFNKFVPLQNATLRQKLLDEASKAGIEGSRVYQVDKSKQTKQMNAYVTGVGPTKRIVMWDTLLAKMTDDEILAVMGHEMGHYVLNHVWKGLAFGIVLGLVVFFISQRVIEWGLARWGVRWGATSAGDPAALPFLLLVLTLFGFILAPVLNGFSRHIEHEADVFSLNLVHLNEPMARAFVKLAEDSKQDPNPSPFIEWWMYSHPSLQRRIDFVLHYGKGNATTADRTPAGATEP